MNIYDPIITYDFSKFNPLSYLNNENITENETVSDIKNILENEKEDFSTKSDLTKIL